MYLEFKKTNNENNPLFSHEWRWPYYGAQAVVCRDKSLISCLVGRPGKSTWPDERKIYEIGCVGYIRSKDRK